LQDWIEHEVRTTFAERETMIDWPCYNATRHTTPAPLENAA
jgi:hypothetical protein